MLTSMTQSFGQNVYRSGFNSSREVCLWPWRICPLLNTIIRYICKGAYRLQLWRFRQEDYVHLQREVSTALDVWAGRTTLREKKVLPSGVLLLEGKDGRKCRGHSKKCAPCHLPIKGTLHVELIVGPRPNMFSIFCV